MTKHVQNKSAFIQIQFVGARWHEPREEWGGTPSAHFSRGFAAHFRGLAAQTKSARLKSNLEPTLSSPDSDADANMYNFNAFQSDLLQYSFDSYQLKLKNIRLLQVHFQAQIVDQLRTFSL